MAAGNGIEGARFGSPPSPYSEGFSNSRLSRIDAKAQRIALAIFVSLASFVFLPPKIAVLTSVFVILWACCYNSDSGESKIQKQRDSYFPPSPNLFSDGQGSSSQERAPSPPLLTPNPFPDSHSSFNQEEAASLQLPTPVDRGSFSQGSPAVIPSKSPVFRAPPPEFRIYSRPDSWPLDNPSDFFPVEENANSSSASFNPPAGSQRHPGEVLGSPVDAEYFSVGNRGSLSQTSTAVLPSKSSVLRASSSDSRLDPKPASRSSGRSSDYSSVSSNSSYTSSSRESTNTDSGYSYDSSYEFSYEPANYPTGYTNTDSDYYSVGGDSSSSISFDPPAGSQQHPNEGLGSHVDTEYFSVGNG